MSSITSWKHISTCFGGLPKTRSFHSRPRCPSCCCCGWTLWQLLGQHGAGKSPTVPCFFPAFNTIDSGFSRVGGWSYRNIVGFVLLVLGGGVEVTFVDIRIYVYTPISWVMGPHDHVVYIYIYIYTDTHIHLYLEHNQYTSLDYN